MGPNPPGATTDVLGAACGALLRGQLVLDAVREALHPTPPRLSPQQAKALAVIAARERYGVSPPTLQILADVLGVSRERARQHVEHLVLKGFLKKSPHCWRGLRLADPS